MPLSFVSRNMGGILTTPRTRLGEHKRNDQQEDDRNHEIKQFDFIYHHDLRHTPGDLGLAARKLITPPQLTLVKRANDGRAGAAI